MTPLRSIPLALLLASACIGIPAQAQDTMDTRQVAMQRYLRAVPMAKVMEDTYAEMAKQVPPEIGRSSLLPCEKSCALTRSKR
jgi:hypothetical protein